MADELGAELGEWGPGTAVVRCTVRPQHVNFLGGAHGGLIFSLGDIAMSYASNGYGRVALAIRIDVSYLRGVEVGEVLTADATTSHVSRRFGHHQLDLSVGGRLVAQATGTTYRTDDWHFGADAWPEDWPHR